MQNNSAIGESWEEVRYRIFTPEEIAESDLRVALIGELIRARQERGITQKQLEEMSGVTQPVIARLEHGTTSPNVSTLMKVLAPLGKKLAIVPMWGIHDCRSVSCRPSGDYGGICYADNLNVLQSIRHETACVDC